MSNNQIGQAIYELAQELFPICRSLTGDGVRQTLNIICREIPNLVVHEVPSGTECFDWKVPPEWNIRDGFILDPEGEKIVDFQKCNLHVLGYSTPVDQTVSLEELQEHLYSIPNQPDAIPFVSSFYKERWGFCLTEEQRQNLRPGNYRVYIDSTLQPGHLTYGELILPGESEQEIFLSTYLCHPSLGNDNLSGVTVTAYLAKWLQNLEHRRYTYRIIFIPETIGSIYYLSRHLDTLKKHVVAGFNITCVGDDRGYSYLPSRAEDTLSDRVALHVLKHTDPHFKKYSYLERGSDERQYCSPGVDLPIASVMRSKYHDFPEYHTSKDDLNCISAAGLQGGYEVLQNCLRCLEYNETLKTAVICEPHLSKYGLYPTLTTLSLDIKEKKKVSTNTLLDLIAYCDGTRDLLDVAEKINEKFWDLIEPVGQLKQAGLFHSCE